MFCMQEETRVTKEMQGGEEFTWCGGGGALLIGLLRWRCCGGDWWLCRGSRTMTPSSCATISSGRERGYCSSLLFCFLSSSSFFSGFPLSSRFVFLISYPVSSFSFLFLCFGSSFLFSLSFPFRFVFSSLRFVLSSLLLLLPSNPHSPSFLSPTVSPMFMVFPVFFFFGPFPFLFPSFSSLCSLFSLLVPPLMCWRWASIYRAKGAGALYCYAWGVGQRRVGWWARLARRGAPDFSLSRCVGLRAFAGHASRSIK